MKKLILAAAIMIITGGTLSAQTGNWQRGTNKNCPGYVDNNKDGICDNVGTCRGQGQGLRNGRGNGQNKNSNAAFSTRRGNGNGICPYQNQSPRNGRVTGRGR